MRLLVTVALVIRSHEVRAHDLQPLFASAFELGDVQRMHNQGLSFPIGGMMHR